MDRFAIAIVADGVPAASAIRDALRASGTQVHDLSARAAVRADRLPYDAVLIHLDVVGVDALELVRRMRAYSTTALVVLADQPVEGLELAAFMAGADDFIAKPSDQRLLVARLRAVLRRLTSDRGALDTDRVVVGTLVVDRGMREVYIGQRCVPLTKIEFDLLAALATSPRRVVSRAELVEAAWGAYSAERHTLDVQLSRLRRKIADAGGGRIATPVAGVGYRLGLVEAAEA